MAKAARDSRVPRECLQQWVKQREELQEMSAERQLSVRKRWYVVQDMEARLNRSHFPELEASLVDWLTALRRDGITVSGDCIKMQSKRLFKDVYPDSNPDDFKASNGWLEKFTIRHNITFRSVTSQGQKIPENAEVIARQFLSFFSDKLTENRIKNVKNIANMDETPLWFDLPNSKSYDFRGVKTVKAKTTGHEKLRYTVVLSAMGDGQKLKPMIIFKNLKNIPKGNFPKDVNIQVAKGGSMTAMLMNTWKREVWSIRPGAIWKSPSLLVYDSVSSHTKASILASFKRHYNTTVAVIPGGMTPLLQPADSHWNRPFKAMMKRKWLDWLQCGEAEYTKSGKRKQAVYDLVARWVSESWKEVPVDVIQRSFIECGLFPDGEQEVLHGKLRAVLEEKCMPPDEDVPTGLTDDEEDDELDEDEEENEEQCD
jgi:hypothetical protein